MKLIILILISLSIFANPFIERYKNELHPKYRNCFNQFITFKSYDMHYCFVKSNSSELYIISPGRNESGLKYTELAQDIIDKKNSNILIIDHLNQGFSTHVVEGTDKVHIEDFNDYFDMTNELITKILKENNHISSINGFAHSMGAYILFETAKKQTFKFNNLYLSSPMFGINTRGIPMPLAIVLARSLSTIGFKTNYAFFQGPYNNKPFALSNLNTRNPERYDFANYVYTLNPELKSAGSTFGWVNEVLKSTKHVEENLEKIASTNVTIFQAGMDKVVDIDVQSNICNKLANCKLIFNKDSYHDFIHEFDNVRSLIYKEMNL